ncbi:MAG: FAD-binding molybdopterin dehydrogenase [Candidatus Rokuibacteriota bacterium]|nr:MAG: FAD-binding molybdopterin dehydrogenase [Candidatus Rokubacteria bacterium]
MDLNTIVEVKRPSSADEVTGWPDGHAWLAGGTWLFSEPQLGTDTLVDLGSLHWPSLHASADGLDVAATCKIVELDRFKAPAAWTAAPLFRECCRSLLASFKIWNEATVGGNICMSLPAGPMISLTVALEGVYTLWPRDSTPRDVAAVDFVTGDHANVLRPGELLRNIRLPARALSKRFAFRRSSLTHLGRSAVLLIGTRSAAGDDLLLTVTAATARPVQLRLDRAPSADELRHAIDRQIANGDYFTDVHGSPAYRRRLTYYYAEQIRAELAGAER